MKPRQLIRIKRTLYRVFMVILTAALLAAVALQTSRMIENHGPKNLLLSLGVLAMLLLGWLAWRRGWLSSLWKIAKTQEVLTPDQKTTALKAGIWLQRWAYLPEFLSVLLTLSWAFFARDAVLFRWVFSLGFLSFVAFRALSFPAAVDAFQARRWGLFSGAGMLAAGSLALLLATSLFDLVNNAGDERHARIEGGKTAQALDQQIAEAQREIEALAKKGYADSAAADAEIEANQTAAASRSAEVVRLQAQIQSAQMEADGIFAANARYMKADCTPKRDRRGQPYTTKAGEACQAIQQAQANIPQWQARIDALSGVSPPTKAQEGVQSYGSLQKHLTGLLKQRAALVSNGEGAQEAWRSEDILVAKAFGLDPETASFWKWFLFAAAFDALALLARIVGRMLINIAGGNPQAEARRKFNALLAAGYSEQEAAAMIANGTTGTFNRINAEEAQPPKQPFGFVPATAATDAGAHDGPALNIQDAPPLRVDADAQPEVIKPPPIYGSPAEWNQWADAKGCPEREMEAIKALVRGIHQNPGVTWNERNIRAFFYKFGFELDRAALARVVGVVKRDFSRLIPKPKQQTKESVSFGFIPQGYAVKRQNTTLNDPVSTVPLNDPVETDPLNAPVKRQGEKAGRVGGSADCAHCGEPYTVMTWNQRFCCEPCRVAAWEKRTGARLKKGRR